MEGDSLAFGPKLVDLLAEDVVHQADDGTDTPTAHAQRAVDAVTGAHDGGAGADLKFSLLETEGGRAYLWVRTRAGGSAEEFLHILDSEFGNEEWILRTCAGLEVDPSGMPFGTDCADSQQL